MTDWTRPGVEGAAGRRGSGPATPAPAGPNAPAAAPTNDQRGRAAYQADSERPGGPGGSGSPLGAATGVVEAPARRREPPPARRGPRRTKLAVRRLDSWSVLKLSFLYGLALLIVFVVAVGVLWSVLNSMGVFTSIDTTLKDFSISNSNSIATWFSFRRIVGWAAVVGAANVVLVTALATLGALLYNVCADLVGGVEITLSERE